MSYVVRNHTIEYFLQCRMKHRLKKEGWTAYEAEEYLEIGQAVHAGVAEWSVSKNKEKAMVAAIAEIPEENYEEAKEKVYLIMTYYFDEYKHDDMQIISPEIEITWPLCEGIDYGAKLDGLAEIPGRGLWVPEHKTSGQKPGNFWKKYEFDRQTLGYTWIAREKYELPIRGTMVNAIFKPDRRQPEPKFERQYFEYTEEQITIWLTETIEIAKEMKKTDEEGPFYRSGRCFMGWGAVCEFHGYCSDGMRLPVLQNTHYVDETRIRR